MLLRYAFISIKLGDGIWSTPLELAHGIKLDLRVLFKVFGLAAIRCKHLGDNHVGKFDAQSIPMIAVGCCPNSNGLLFYNPSNGTFVSSIDYKFQMITTSGAYFGYKYQAGTFFYCLDESSSIFSPKYALDTPVYVHTHSPPSLATIIGIPTYQTPDIYTVAFKDGSLSEYSEDLLSLAPVPSSSQTISLLPPWLKGGTKATLFLHDMTKPRHGTLQLLSDNIWTFYPGKSTTGIPLPDLQANCQHLLDTGQLFRSHAKFKNVYAARSQESLYDCVLRHVSAHGLQSLIAPTSLKHHSKMDPEDKIIWDSAYDEEYGDLVRVLSW